MRQLLGNQPLLFTTLLLSLMLVSTGASLADECQADFRTELMTREEDSDSVRLSFKVEVSAREKCASIVYEFLVNVETPEGETTTHRQEVRIKITGDTKDQKLRYEMPLRHRMLDYEAKQISCSICASP